MLQKPVFEPPLHERHSIRINGNTIVGQIDLQQAGSITLVSTRTERTKGILRSRGTLFSSNQDDSEEDAWFAKTADGVETDLASFV